LPERWQPQALHQAEAARRALPDLLSVALMQSRNVTLAWLQGFESAQWPDRQPDSPLAVDVLLEIARVAWAQEFWIARNVQRHRGTAASSRAPRLPSVHPHADRWWSPQVGSRRTSDAQEVRQFLALTLESTLELLQGLPPAHQDDEGLHLFRWALLHEDRLCERLAVAAQWLGVSTSAGWSPPHGQAPPARALRAPLWMPSQTFEVGSAPGGLVPPPERWHTLVSVPEFEIDAQAVTWSQMGEFAQDGGYDDARWWSAAGWDWASGHGRRAPRGVVQWHAGALREVGGRLQRVPLSQAVAHVSYYEAQAWCAWAGRRLPTEVEWELCACTAASRGFVWGDVWEWTLGQPRPWQASDGPSDGAPVAGFGEDTAPAQHRVLRGASSWTAPRCIHPRSRRFVAPERDELFVGFRSCSL